MSAHRPPLWVVLHHSVSRPETTVDEIRRWHRARGFRDIGYHYVVRLSDHGWVWERGRPEEEVGAHCKGWNESTLGICVCGDYTRGPLPDAAFEVLCTLLRDILRRYQMTARQVTGHGRMPGQATACPGFDVDAIRAELTYRGS